MRFTIALRSFLRQLNRGRRRLFVFAADNMPPWWFSRQGEFIADGLILPPPAGS